jgi:predicted Rossmann-fold nucleotide-binding protein
LGKVVMAQVKGGIRVGLEELGVEVFHRVWCSLVLTGCSKGLMKVGFKGVLDNGRPYRGKGRQRRVVQVHR